MRYFQKESLQSICYMHYGSIDKLIVTCASQCECEMVRLRVERRKRPQWRTMNKKVFSVLTKIKVFINCDLSFSCLKSLIQYKDVTSGAQRKGYYRAAIHYSSLKYSPALEERNSREFRELAREVQRDLENLLRNLLGIHTITILHVSRGLLVTFDLGSVGEATEDEIRDTLLDSVRRGRIGNQTVSGQGFTFSKIPEVSCPSHVGRNPDKLPRSGNNWANLLVNNVFPCDGNIVGWEYYRIIPQGSAYVGVWRQDLFDSHFNLISKTELPSAPVGIREVSTNPISVKKGDFIGIFYPRTTPNNVIAQAQLADEILSSNELYQNFHIEIFDDDITQNNNLINLENIDYNTINATFSLRAVMDYEVGPTIPAIILECKPNEFNCGDDCISQDLYCDDQIDCNNESDEKDCAPEPATCPRGLFLCDDGTCQRTCNCLEGRFRCNDGTCIERVQKCNGQFNCPDGSDEGAVCQGHFVETTERQCSDEEFQCYTGTPICIPKDEECNGIPECEDKSDELPDRCSPTFPTVLPACPPDYVRCQDGTCRKETCDDPTFPTVPPACPPDYVRCQDGACRKTNCEDCRDLSLESRLAIAIPLAILVFVILVVFIVKFRPSKSVTVRTSQPDSSSK